MRKLLVIVIPVIFFILNGCVSEIEKNQPKDYNIALSSLNLSNINDDLGPAWLQIIENYGMDVICSCDCENIEKIPNMVESVRNFFPSTIILNRFNFTTCDELKPLYKYECSSPNLREKIDSFNIVITESNLFTFEEIELLNEFKVAVFNNTINKPYFIKRWQNLETENGLDNNLSLIIIETGISINSFIRAHPNYFQGDEDIQALWHVTGGIIGGYVNVLYQCTKDLVCDTGFGDTNADEEIQGAFIDGFITGAFGSI